ncbi:unnamed protein product [Ilex paraguariensis]|uniref:Cytochrome P450 n=1 Tax=Ilex paraguariensis TaxID=185542 RepID=A0ABC8UES0_9AQUA
MQLIDNSAPHLCLWQLSKTYGPLMSLQLGTVPTLVVSSAKMAKEIMKTHDLTFSSRPTSYGPQKLSYNASDVVFSPYNDSWREKRKICTLNLFSHKRVQSFRPIREDEVCRMIKKISEQASSSKLTNLSEIVMSLACSIICRVAFGKSYDDEGYESSRFHGLFYEVQAVASSFFISDYFPLFGWVDKLTGLHARLEKIFKQTDIFYQELINDHLGPNRAKSVEEDVIDILLQLKKDQLSSIHLSFDDIKAVIMVIINIVVSNLCF